MKKTKDLKALKNLKVKEVKPLKYANPKEQVVKARSKTSAKTTEQIAKNIYKKKK
jgi:hypothetical protein